MWYCDVHCHVVLWCSLLWYGQRGNHANLYFSLEGRCTDQVCDIELYWWQGINLDSEGCKYPTVMFTTIYSLHRMYPKERRITSANVRSASCYLVEMTIWPAFWPAVGYFNITGSLCLPYCSINNDTACSLGLSVWWVIISYACSLRMQYNAC
jgi:hypothetical protein